MSSDLNETDTPSEISLSLTDPNFTYYYDFGPTPQIKNDDLYTTKSGKIKKVIRNVNNSFRRRVR